MHRAGIAIIIVGVFVATCVFGLLPIAVALPVSEAAAWWGGVVFIVIMVVGVVMALAGG